MGTISDEKHLTKIERRKDTGRVDMTKRQICSVWAQMVELKEMCVTNNKQMTAQSEEEIFNSVTSNAGTFPHGS